MSKLSFRAPVVSFEKIEDFIIKLRAERKSSVVFTNGCFDLLHPGHLQILEKAKQLGDYLIVGVNSDVSVRRLKGETRPVQSLESRMAVLASLRVVDCVVAFSDDTPYKLIERILPDVLVKGGDYTIDQIVGAELVQNTGGVVDIIPLVQGFSTTSIAAKIRG